MRLCPALIAFLLPVAVVAQSDEWLRDDMSDDSLVLLKTSNLKSETTTSSLLPGSIGGAGQWVMSQGSGPAYVVYFIPGRIEEVEIDTHRMAGSSGDFSLAVSTDGKLYQPLDAGSVTLDSAFGWDYRLMSADSIPSDATHLLVRFPDGSSAHRLSEVWIKYQWDDALASRFLPAPAVQTASTSPAGNYASQSDTELEAMLRQLQNVAPAKDSVSAREKLPGNDNPMSAATSVLQTSGHPDAPPSVAVNLMGPTAETTGANQPMSFKFGDASASNTPAVVPILKEDDEEKKPDEASENGLPTIELHLDGAPPAKTAENTPQKSDSAKDATDEKPEVVWVVPTLTLPVPAPESGEKQGAHPTESPAGNLQIKIDEGSPESSKHEAPGDPITDAKPDSISVSSLALEGNAPESAADPNAVDSSNESAVDQSFEVRVELPTATAANDAREASPTPAATEPPVVEAAANVADPVASVSKAEESADLSEPDDARPVMTFTRHGPRSKSHAFFSSRR